MSKKKEILLSGIQPSGTQHIGNYFGAIQRFVEMQDEYQSYVMIADLHALTSLHDREQLRENILDVAITYLSVGLDPEKVVLFRQSDVPEHTELAWIFNCLVTVPYMQRAHAYKDKVAKGISPSLGLLAYPMLQAADILIYRPDIVPVGEDQRQHVEYTRDVAGKFNEIFGETFTLPKPRIEKSVGVIPGTDGNKMSKSAGNDIKLFATDDEIEKAVMKIPTDSQAVDAPKNPEDDHIFALHKLFAGEKLKEIRQGYEKGGLSYGDSKKMLIEEIISYVTPLREKREKIASDRAMVLDVLEEGRKKASKRARETMERVRDNVGLTII